MGGCYFFFVVLFSFSSFPARLGSTAAKSSWIQNQSSLFFVPLLLVFFFLTTQPTNKKGFGCISPTNQNL